MSPNERFWPTGKQRAINISAEVSTWLIPEDYALRGGVAALAPKGRKSHIGPPWRRHGAAEIFSGEKLTPRMSPRELWSRQSREAQGMLLSLTSAACMGITYVASKGRGVPAGAAARMTMLDALKEAEDPVRIAAADHFGRLGAADAIPLLTAAARDGSLPLREAAYRALCNIAMTTGQRVLV